VSWPAVSSADPLRFVESIPLPGVEGRIDHMAADSAGQHLYIAALGNNTVEVVDLAVHKLVHSIPNLHEPQGVACLDGSNQIAVANGETGSCQFFDVASFKPTGAVEFQSDADNARYDSTKRQLFVGFGNGALGVINAESLKHLTDIKLPA